jgi:uncharacterized protein (TIGR02284 family)
MRQNPDAITILHTLVHVNTKRFERYKYAAGQMKDINRKLLFMNYAVQSQEFINNLNKWLIAYGNVSVSLSESNSNYNFLVRTWTGLKGILSLDEKKYIVSNCEFVERESIKAYKNALQEAVLTLPAATLADIQRQSKELEGAYSMIKSLKENNALDLQVA